MYEKSQLVFRVLTRAPTAGNAGNLFWSTTAAPPPSDAPRAPADFPQGAPDLEGGVALGLKWASIREQGAFRGVAEGEEGGGMGGGGGGGGGEWRGEVEGARASPGDFSSR